MTYIEKDATRTALWMGMIFVPVFALLFFVVTMQRTNCQTSLHRDSRECYAIRFTDRSFLGQSYRRKLEAFDLADQRWVNEWLVDPDVNWFWVLEKGERLLHLLHQNSTLVEVHEGQIRVLAEDFAASVANRNWYSPVELTNNGLLFKKRQTGRIHLFDVKEGVSVPVSFAPPVQRHEHWEYYQHAYLAVWSSANDSRRIFHLIGNVATELGTVDGLLSGISKHGNWCVRSADPTRETASVLELASGKKIARVDNNQFDRLRVVDNRMYGIARRINSSTQTIQRLDPASGNPIGPTLALPIREWQFDRSGTRVYMDDGTSALATLNVDTGLFSRRAFGPGMPWWWPLRIFGITAAVVWWLAWSLRMGRNRRSYQPFVDVAILHVTLLACFAVRLYAHVNGPSWSGDLDNWEGAGLLGTAASAIGLVVLWVIFGSQRLGVRLSLIGFAAAALVGFAIVIWDASQATGDHSIDRMRTVVGTVSSGVAMLAILGGFAWHGIRLLHRTDATVDEKPHERGFGIRHMIVWTIAIALIFVAFQSRSFRLPATANLLNLMASGFASGLATAMLLWLGLGRTRWRFLLAAIAIGIAGGLYWVTQSANLLPISAAFVPILLASTLALRWNGYSLGRPMATTVEAYG
ncbi:MAG: hypothetical protein AAFU85_09235 [Planctomycetota bacterium]